MPIEGGLLILNPADVAVSGQIALGAYEKFETSIFLEAIKPGMTIVDIGANIGYYATIAGHKTGKQGRVFAYEPEPENYSFLEKNILENKLSQVIALKITLTDKPGRQEL